MHKGPASYRALIEEAWLLVLRTSCYEERTRSIIDCFGWWMARGGIKQSAWLRDWTFRFVFDVMDIEAAYDIRGFGAQSCISWRRDADLTAGRCDALSVRREVNPSALMTFLEKRARLRLNVYKNAKGAK